MVIERTRHAEAPSAIAARPEGEHEGEHKGESALRLASDGSALWLIAADGSALQVLAAHDSEGTGIDAAAFERRFGSRSVAVDH
jgi:hypothetical protein